MPVKTGAQQVWETALGQLQLQVSRPSYETWLRDTVGISLDQDLLKVGVPTPFAAEWLERRMYQLIQRTVTGIANQPLHLQFHVVTQHRNGRPQDNGATAPTTNGHPVSAEPRPSNGNEHAPGLNRRYTFDTFVIGKSNQLAHAAAAAIPDHPGEAYNPLFIYGGVGLGKTHLLHAIAHAAAHNQTSYLYVTAEQFTNDFIRAIRGRKTEEFRAKYRSIDILLLDDIQFIAGKEQTQEVFFHTFNDLHNANRQIVVTCDRSPKVLPLLEDRLRSRFQGGLITDIQPPDLETRLAILQTKAAHLDSPVSDDVLMFIAERLLSNIRELEGSLNRLAAWAHFKNVPITLELASLALAELPSKPPASEPTPQAVINLVAKYYNLSCADIVSKRRDRRTTLARQVAISLLSSQSCLSPKEITSLFGQRDPSLITRACTRVNSLQNGNAAFREELSSLRTSITGSP